MVVRSANSKILHFYFLILNFLKKSPVLNIQKTFQIFGTSRLCIKYVVHV